MAKRRCPFSLFVAPQRGMDTNGELKTRYGCSPRRTKDTMFEFVE